MKRKVFLALSLVMLLLVYASSPGWAISGSAGTKAKAIKPVTLKIYTRDSGYCKPGIQDGEFGNYIKDKLGIIMDLTPSQLIPDYDQKLSAMVAAGSLPDIVWTQNADIQKILVKSGSIIPLDSLLKTNGKDILNELGQREAYAKQYQNFGTGQKTYFIRWAGDGTGNPLNPSFGYWVRWDLYKQLGYPKVENTDELINVLADMVKLHPKTPAGQKTYAIGMNNDWGLAFQVACMTNYVTGYGNMLDVAYQYETGATKRGYFLDKNGPLYKNFKFMNMLYLRGLLDPDSVTQNWTQLTDKVNAGRYMMVLFDWYAPTLKDEPGSKYLPLPPMKNTEYYPLSYPAPLGNDGFCYSISKNCKNPAKAMDLLNFLSSYEGSIIYYNGIEGKQWDMVNGSPTLRPAIQDMIVKKDAEAIKKLGLQPFNFVGHEVTAYYPKLKSTVDFSYSPTGIKSMMDSAMKDYVNHYKIQKPLDMFTNIKSTQVISNLLSFMSTNIPQDIKDIQNNVNNYANQNWSNMVLAKNDAEFASAVDKYISDMKAMGIVKASDWFESDIKSSVSKYKALVKK